MGPLTPLLMRLAQHPGLKNVMNRASGWPKTLIQGVENSTLWRMLDRQGFAGFRPSIGEVSKNLGGQASRPGTMPGGFIEDVSSLGREAPNTLPKNILNLPNALTDPEEAKRLFELFQYYMTP